LLRAETFERKLDDEERPLEIKQTVQKCGQLEHFKFVFKSVTTLSNGGGGGGFGGDDDDDDNLDYSGDGGGGSSSDDANIFGHQASKKKKNKKQKSMANDCARAGYLEKRGQRNKAFKRRWFVLQGKKLHYFKSHEHSRAISHLSVADAHICLSAACTHREFLFEIDTKKRTFFLRAQTQNDMMRWVRELKRHSVLESQNRVMNDIQTLIDEMEYTRSMAAEQRCESLRTLRGILQDPEALDHFMNYVVDNHCDENLLFWVDAENYRLSASGDDGSSQNSNSGGNATAAAADATTTIPPDAKTSNTNATTTTEEKQRKEPTAQQLFNKFLKRGSEYEIAASHKLRCRTQELITSGDASREAFCALQNNALSLMESLNFHAFLKSKHYRRALLRGSIAREKMVLRNHPYRNRLVKQLRAKKAAMRAAAAAAAVATAAAAGGGGKKKKKNRNPNSEAKQQQQQQQQPPLSSQQQLATPSPAATPAPIVVVSAAAAASDKLLQRRDTTSDKPMKTFQMDILSPVSTPTTAVASASSSSWAVTSIFDEDEQQAALATSATAADAATSTAATAAAAAAATAVTSIKEEESAEEAAAAASKDNDAEAKPATTAKQQQLGDDVMDDFDVGLSDLGIF
jgi:hypothetical protein